MYDNQVITAIAQPSSGNQEIIQLHPLQVVRESTPGSGQFIPINGNGPLSSAVLPVYTTKSGTGFEKEKGDRKEKGDKKKGTGTISAPLGRL
jgi:hypothetical protein